jgi:dTDP-glucose pyrophosphorylase
MNPKKAGLWRSRPTIKSKHTQLAKALADIHDGLKSLLRASAFVEMIERRQSLKISCPEEIAYRMGFIDSRQLAKLAEPLTKSGYGQYLLQILTEGELADS